MTAFFRYLWANVSHEGMQRYQFAFADCIEELRHGWRKDGFLASVTVQDGAVEAISEVYTP